MRAREQLLLASVAATSLVAVNACTDHNAPDDADVVGPFTGALHRYAVDAVLLPQTQEQAIAVGDELDGRYGVGNQFGSVVVAFAGEGDTTTHAPDMIASGVLASVIEIRAHDLRDDPRVGVTLYGADGDVAVPVGGRFTDGVFVSNRTASTTHPGTARAHLPIFADADPLVATMVGLEIDLQPDGSGGFIATVRGGIPAAEALPDVGASIAQMLAASPSDHLWLGRFLDANHDGDITVSEIEANYLLGSLLSSDVSLPDGEPVVSLGYQLHLAPCASGHCLGSNFASCYDRLSDGRESGLDCGGPCGACAGGDTCRDGSDCQTVTCDGGLCTAPACDDGVRDGFESDVDCGGHCPACGAGQICESSDDCESGRCTVDAMQDMSVGTCEQ